MLHLFGIYPWKTPRAPVLCTSVHERCSPPQAFYGAIMAAFLKQHYGECEGPLGIPCLDRQARALDKVLRALPKDALYAPGQATVEKATTELLPGERSDVSWIST